MATVAMLVCSNVFMTFAWYWHLRLQKPGAASWPIYAIILVSWLIALVEYIILIPANRLGATSGLNVAQLKITQEVITVCVFVPFMILFMGEKWRWDYLWAFLCMVLAMCVCCLYWCCCRFMGFWGFFIRGVFVRGIV